MALTPKELAELQKLKNAAQTEGLKNRAQHPEPLNRQSVSPPPPPPPAPATVTAKKPAESTLKELQNLEESFKKETASKTKVSVQKNLLLQQDMVRKNQQLQESLKKSNNQKVLTGMVFLIKTLELIKKEHQAKHLLKDEGPSRARREKKEPLAVPLEEGEKESVDEIEKNLVTSLNKAIRHMDFSPNQHLLEQIEAKLINANGQIVFGNQSRTVTPDQYAQEVINTANKNLNKTPRPEFRSSSVAKDEKNENGYNSPSPFGKLGKTPKLEPK